MFESAVKSRNFNVRFPEDLVNRLDERAESERRSRNDLLKLIVEDFLDGNLIRKPEEHIERSPVLRRAY